MVLIWLCLFHFFEDSISIKKFADIKYLDYTVVDLELFIHQEWDDSALCESDMLAKLSFDHDDDKLMRGQ